MHDLLSVAQFLCNYSIHYWPNPTMIASFFLLGSQFLLFCTIRVVPKTQFYLMSLKGKCVSGHGLAFCLPKWKKIIMNHESKLISPLSFPNLLHCSEVHQLTSDNRLTSLKMERSIFYVCVPHDTMKSSMHKSWDDYKDTFSFKN